VNILVLSTWFPYPPDNGSRLRAFYLLRHLAESGHRVRLIAGVQADSEYREEKGIPEPLAALCASVTALPWRWHGDAAGTAAAARGLFSPVPRSIAETYDPAIAAAVARELAKPTDAVFVLELGMDAYIPPDCHAPLILEQAELSSLSVPGGVRELFSRRKARDYWRGRLAKYPVITAVSEAEADAARTLAPFRASRYIAVVPNGVDTGAYDPGARCPAPGRLLYNGSLSYEPNCDAVMWFVQDILPRLSERVPEITLVVTGRYDPSAPEIQRLRANDRVRMTGFLPDLRAELAEAALCIVPLRSGGGTRLKILEAWAAGVPVVSTAVGAAGLAGEQGKHLRIAAEEPAAFADAVAHLLADPAAGEALARNARRLAEERYDWSVARAYWDAALDWVVNVSPDVSYAYHDKRDSNTEALSQ